MALKQGYINASGFNLVASTERNGVRLVGVVFGGKTGQSRDKHMISLLNRQFKRIKPVQVKSTPQPATPITARQFFGSNSAARVSETICD